MLTYWERSYVTAAGQIKVRIDYDLTYSVYSLNFDVINIGNLGYGYEDDDQLTFYPNTFKLSFDDLEKKYYDVLKLSLGEYDNSFPINFFKYGGLTLWLNDTIKFKGYIDQLTLQYNEENRTVEFECIDASKALRDLNVENLLPTDYHDLAYLIYLCYKKVYPDLRDQVYSTQNFSNGIYVKHDWKFTGNRIFPAGELTRDWSNIGDFRTTYFNFNSTGIFGESRPARTYADLIKLMALQFGMTIGTADYNKIYMVKRFLLVGGSFVNLDSKIIGPYKRYLHLPAIVGARNKNTYNGLELIYTAGFVETINNGELKYINLVKEFNTFVGSYLNQPIGGGSTISATAIIVAPEYPVYSGVTDPALGFRGHIAETICQWYYRTRIRPKDKIECELEGIDYNLFSFYEITNPGNPTLKFRPMSIEVDLLENKTKMIAIEV